MSLDRLDITNTGLSGSLQVVLVARAGNTSIRHNLGAAASPNKAPLPIDGLDRSQPIRFRVLLREDGNPKLAASVENIRPRDDSQSESLLPMEPAELGEVLWKLLVTEDGPVLQFNSRVFPSAAGAENYVPFGAFVLPEALRQVMRHIVSHPDCLDDEGDPWSAWAVWIDVLGCGRPPADGEEEEMNSWCDSVAYRFADRFGFATRLQDELLKGTGSD